MIKTLNMKVISYCELPEELTSGHWISDFMCGCYVEFALEDEGEDELCDWIRAKYPELGDEKFLIEIDY